MMETSIHQEGMLKSVFYPPLKVWRLINGLEFPRAECSPFSRLQDWTAWILTEQNILSVSTYL